MRAWLYYRQVGDVPPKRHTQLRDARGGLYYEELMGEEGFSSDSSLLYHRGIPSADRRRQVWELPDQSPHAEPSAASRGTCRLHDLVRRSTEDGADAVTGRRLVLGNADVRISYVVAARASPALPQRHRRRVRLRRVGRRHRRDGVRRAARTARATTWSCRGPPRTAGCPTARSRCALRDRGQQPHRAAEALPVAVRPVPRARAVLRARPARARPSRSWSRATDVEVLVKHRGRAGGVVGTRHDLRRPTRSTSSAGTAASTPTRSTSPTSSRSPAGCTSRRRCTRSSRATTS